MGRKKVVREPFVSIEEDMRLLGMEVQHEGMTKEEALQLVGEATAWEVDAIEEAIPGTGFIRYEREKPGHPPLARDRFYGIEDARYHVAIVGRSGKGILLENWNQWELFKRVYLGDVAIRVDSEHDDSEFERRLLELTGMTVQEFARKQKSYQDETAKDSQEVQGIRIPVADLDLIETAIEDYDIAV
jgi:hypothetical protein